MKKTAECPRKDNAEYKRVEHNMHTNFSAMDGVDSPQELIRRAFGHRAADITDHGNVQVFLTVMKAVCEKAHLFPALLRKHRHSPLGEQLTALKVGGDNQRENCGCVKCDDIGSYGTCPHGCFYCYANYRGNIIADKLRAYDINSPLLCDSIKENDKVTDRPVKSYKQGFGQITLFD